jgi:hypothetical protein
MQASKLLLVSVLPMGLLIVSFNGPQFYRNNDLSVRHAQSLNYHSMVMHVPTRSYKLNTIRVILLVTQSACQ